MVPLARQELRIAWMIVSGLRQSEIATELGIATNTVKTYVARIRAKTGYQRESTQLSFEVFLDRLLREEPVPRLEAGTSCYAAVLNAVRHVPELRDAVRLMRAGYAGLVYQRSLLLEGERRTEWKTTDGIPALVIAGRYLHYRSEILEIHEDVRE